MTLPGLLTLIATILLLPPKWDPAIRIKERQIRNGTHPESRKTDRRQTF